MSITLLFKVVDIKGNILLNITFNEKKFCFENEFVFIATLSKKKKNHCFIYENLPMQNIFFFQKQKLKISPDNF